ncbi:MAG: glycosyltransferase family 4 protein [Roseiflexaceae bacterium]
MRIAIDARYIADHFPGIGRYVYNLLLGLAALDQPHTLIVLHNPALPNTRHDIAALARFAPVELAATAARPFSATEQVAVPRLLHRLRADLYHAPYYVRPYAGLPCPAVVTLYDAIPHLFPNEVSPRARLLFDLLTRLAIRSSRRVIAISQSASDDLIAAYRVPRARIAVTPLAADPRFRPQPPATIAAARAKYGLPERYILALTSNKPHKNLVHLIEAYAQTTDHRPPTTDHRPQQNRRTAEPAPLHPLTPSPAHLVIAGHWDPRYPAARELAGRLGLNDVVRFLPGVAEADLPALLSGAQVFAFPSLYEGFGLPPLEALACGAPVLCGEGSSLPEVVGEAALRVDMHSVAALAAGLARLLSDAALREQLRAAGPRRAALFSWRRTAEATLEVYQQVTR